MTTGRINQVTFVRARAQPTPPSHADSTASRGGCGGVTHVRMTERGSGCSDTATTVAALSLRPSLCLTLSPTAQMNGQQARREERGAGGGWEQRWGLGRVFVYGADVWCHTSPARLSVPLGPIAPPRCAQREGEPSGGGRRARSRWFLCAFPRVQLSSYKCSSRGCGDTPHPALCPSSCSQPASASVCVQRGCGPRRCQLPTEISELERVSASCDSSPYPEAVV